MVVHHCAFYDPSQGSVCSTHTHGQFQMFRNTTEIIGVALYFNQHSRLTNKKKEKKKKNWDVSSMVKRRRCQASRNGCNTNGSTHVCGSAGQAKASTELIILLFSIGLSNTVLDLLNLSTTDTVYFLLEFGLLVLHYMH